jgi:hypothetical protein
VYNNIIKNKTRVMMIQISYFLLENYILYRLFAKISCIHSFALSDILWPFRLTQFRCSSTPFGSLQWDRSTFDNFLSLCSILSCYKRSNLSFAVFSVLEDTLWFTLSCWQPDWLWKTLARFFRFQLWPTTTKP